MSDSATDTTHLVPHDLHDPLPQLERNTYWHGKSMGVLEFQRDQVYFRQLQQTLTRLTIGCGILCGLEVSANGPRGVAVSPGAAIDGEGRLVLVPRPVALDDLRTWLCPDDGSLGSGRYRLCLVHHECPTAPAPVVVTDCDTTTRCLPGAVQERFRFDLRPDDPCGVSDQPCGCQGTNHACESACDDCVVLATVTLGPQTVDHLSPAGRRLIPSTFELGDRLGLSTEQDRKAPPRLCSVWPPPGAALARSGAPSEWGRWRLRPRIELTFDQPVDVDRIDDPDDWIRTWVATESTNPQGVRSVSFTRVGLVFLPTASTQEGHRHRLVYELRSRASQSTGQRQVVLIQARADLDTGPAAAAAAGGVARIEYAGTSLPPSLRADIWRADRFSTSETSLDELMATVQPGCFGDAYDGGRVHAAFAIEPVDADAPPTLTAVHPTNGARSGGAEITLELAGTGALDALTPRAWIVNELGHRELALQPSPYDDGESPAVLHRFPAAFDATLADEMASAVRYTAAVEGADRGRVLVVVPSHTDDLRPVGAFAGTCLSDADAAHIHAHGLTAEHYADILPSALRMPRSEQGGTWIHWTFFWEHDHGFVS